MTSLTIEIKGIEEFRKAINSEAFGRKVILGMGKGIENIHKVLQDEVFREYTFVKKLANYRKGSTAKDLRYVPGSLDRIFYSLEYESAERQDLIEFPHQNLFNIVTPSSFAIPNKFAFSDATTNGRINRKKPLESVRVMVRRGDMKTVDSAFTGTILGKKQILKRNNYSEPSWIREPSVGDLEGQRAPFHTLKGPNIISCAENVYKTNINVQNAIDHVTSLIQEALFL